MTRTLGALVSASSLLSCGNGVDDRALSLPPCQTVAEQTCGAVSPGTACAAQAMANCATDYYLRDYPPESLSDCDPTKPILAIKKQLELSIYRYSNINDEMVVPHTEGLQRYYASNQLTMNTAEVAVPDPTRYAIAGTEAELDTALTAAGIPGTATSLTAEQSAAAQQVIDNVISTPIVSFIARHSVPAENKVNVVVIDQIVSPEIIAMMGIDGVIVGLGLSSALIARVRQEGDTSLNTMLQIDGDFTPTLFVGHSDIVRLTGNYDLVIAHEMGHALGLPHVDDQGNLMQPVSPITCRPWLSQDQIDAMGPFTDATLAFGEGLTAPQGGSLTYRRWLAHEGVGPDPADVISSSRDALSHILSARHNVLEYLLARRVKSEGTSSR